MLAGCVAGLAVVVLAAPAGATHTVAITTPSNNAVVAPLAVVSFASSVGGVCPDAVHLWTFGDGIGTSALTNPTYAYALAATYTVTLQVTCVLSHSASASITVIVDGAPPLLAVPGPITAEATGPGGAAVSFSVTATDAIDPSPGVSCAPSSGSTFPVGTTTVACTATDAVGNQATGSFTVTVVDTTPPTLTLPAPITAEATGPGGATVTFAASASDLVSSPTASCSPASGSTFPLGATTVDCSATDGAGNGAAGSFAVTVQDTTDPLLTVPGTQTVEATGPGGATVAFSVSASDLVSGALTPSCAPATGSTFALGTTTVSCTVADGAGNGAAATFDVVVQDTTDPTLSVPAPMTVEATSAAGATATFSATASDLVSGVLTPSCTPAPGSTFPLGSTSVSCSVADGAGNLATLSFDLNVTDTTPPTVTTGGNIGRQAPNATGTIVTFTASAADLVDGVLAPVCTPAIGSLFLVGVTTVVCSIADAAGNLANGTFTVTVTRGGGGIPSADWYRGAGAGSPDPLGGSPEGEGQGGEESGGEEQSDADPDLAADADWRRDPDQADADVDEAAPGGPDDGADGDGSWASEVSEAVERIAGGVDPMVGLVSALATSGIVGVATVLRRVWLPGRT